MQDLTVTLIQTELFWEDIDANIELFDKKIDEITQETDLIILPEMFSRSGNLFGIVVQSVDQIGPGRPQVCQEHRIIASDYHDQSAFDSGRIKDLLGVLGLCIGKKRDQ